MSLENISLNSNIGEAEAYSTDISLTATVTGDTNLIDYDIQVCWTVEEPCTGDTTVNIYRSVNGSNYELITSSTGSCFIDSYSFDSCRSCTEAFITYYATIDCFEGYESPAISIRLTSPVKKDFNLGGILRLFIAQKPNELDYSVVNAKANITDFQGNNIMTINELQSGLTWYELPVDQSVSYEQDLNANNTGFVFTETLNVLIPKLNPAKWNSIRNLVDNKYIVVFLTANGDWCIMGYDTGAEINVYEATTEDSVYTFSFQVINNYNLLKFIDEDYVTQNIL